MFFKLGPFWSETQVCTPRGQGHRHCCGLLWYLNSLGFKSNTEPEIDKARPPIVGESELLAQIPEIGASLYRAKQGILGWSRDLSTVGIRTVAAENRNSKKFKYRLSVQWVSKEVDGSRRLEPWDLGFGQSIWPVELGVVKKRWVNMRAGAGAHLHMHIYKYACEYACMHVKVHIHMCVHI